MEIQKQDSEERLEDDTELLRIVHDVLAAILREILVRELVVILFVQVNDRPFALAAQTHLQGGVVNDDLTALLPNAVDRGVHSGEALFQLFAVTIT